MVQGLLYLLDHLHGRSNTNFPVTKRTIHHLDRSHTLRNSVVIRNLTNQCSDGGHVSVSYISVREIQKSSHSPSL